MPVNDMVILITGAGKGAGRALAVALAERGYSLALNDISPINVENVVGEINSKGGKAKAYIEDVAKKVGAQALIKSIEDDFGRIDVLINHASVEPHVSLLNMDEWDWHRVLDVNLTGTFLMIQSVGRGMRENAKGKILNLVTGENEKSKKDAGAYLSSKAGLAELSHQADVEMSPFGIRVYAIENNGDVVENVLSVLEEV
jgi:3-oxoacyl-[acyl-carrier protein] reductase